MKKRVKSLLVVLCMLITMIPTTFLADEVTGKITCIDHTDEVVTEAEIIVTLWNFSSDDNESVEIATSVNGGVMFDVEMNDTNDAFVYEGKEYAEIEVSYVLPEGYEDLSGKTEDAYWQYADVWYEAPIYELNVINVQKDEETPMTKGTYTCEVLSEKNEVVEGTNIKVFLCNSMGDETDRTVIAQTSNGQLEYNIEYKNNRFWYEEEVYAYIGYSYTLPEGFQCVDGSMGGEIFNEPENLYDITWLVEDLSDGVNGSENEESPYTEEIVVNNDFYSVIKTFYNGELRWTAVRLLGEYNEVKLLEALTYVMKEDIPWVYVYSSAKDCPIISAKVMAELEKLDSSIQISNKTTGDIIMLPKVTVVEDFCANIQISDNAKITERLKAAGVNEGYIQYVVSGTGKQELWAFTDFIDSGIFSIKEESVNNAVYEEKYLYYYDVARDLFVSGDEIGGAQYFESEVFEPHLNIGVYKWGNYVVSDKPLPDSLTNATIGTDITTDTTVEKDVLEDAKENGKSVNVQVEASEKSSFVNWLFDTIDNVVDFIPTVQVDAKIDEIDNTVTGLNVSADFKYTTVSFDFSGTLPGKAEVTLDIENSVLGNGNIKDGQTVYLYYFNPETKEFELVDSSAIREGFATFTMTHCSDYIITTEELPTVVEDTTANTGTTSDAKTIDTTETNIVPKTGDNTMVFGYILFMLVGMCLILTSISTKKNVR